MHHAPASMNKLNLHEKYWCVPLNELSVKMDEINRIRKEFGQNLEGKYHIPSYKLSSPSQDVRESWKIFFLFRNFEMSLREVVGHPPLSLASTFWQKSEPAYYQTIEEAQKQYNQERPPNSPLYPIVSNIDTQNEGRDDIEPMNSNTASAIGDYLKKHPDLKVPHYMQATEDVRGVSRVIINSSNVFLFPSPE